jgi:AraC-like DNA-binding protein
VLRKTILLDEAGIRLEDVRCASHRTDWSPPEPSTGHAVVFVRRGCFRRRVHGAEMLLDPAVVYFENPGEEQQVAHPCDGGDACCRPSTVAARNRAVEDAREALTADPRIGVRELARAVAVSPHHLSRIFSTLTGDTISGYRNRIRVRLALERLAGETSLARLAADLGFADQAHLTRVVRAQVGRAPSHLRLLLAGGILA